MMLISLETVQQLRRSNSIQPDIINRIDTDMKNILNSNNSDDTSNKISDNEKWPALQQILQRYLHFAGQTRNPLEISINEIADPSSSSHTSELTDNIEKIENLR
ncbi:hypothetical protein CBL_08474 [Carabus blaptoides fortunei]